MDDLLPGKMLAKIASYLSYKDVNSLLRASKTARTKLTPHKDILPKLQCEVEINCSVPGKIKFAVSFGEYYVRSDGPMTSRSVVAYLINANATGNRNISGALRFYRHSRVNLPMDERRFPGGVDGLCCHFEAILNLAEIYMIHLIEVDSRFCAELARLCLHQSCSRIASMFIVSDDVHQGHLDLITAFKPRLLDIAWRAKTLPDGFYRLPAVQNLTVLWDNSRNKRVYNLTALTARQIKIFGRHNITIDDVEQLLTQWVESKRQIVDIRLEIQNYKKEKGIAVMDNLDRRLVHLDEADERGGNLTRLCDGEKLRVSLGEYCNFDKLEVNA